MAEFQEVVLQWRRMCKTFTDKSEKELRPCGELCPVGSNHVCGDVTESTQKDMEAFETTVMNWAADHPEPKYPIWAEWMIEQGLCSADLGLITRKAYEYIPADMAQKLGLQPKK